MGIVKAAFECLITILDKSITQTLVGESGGFLFFIKQREPVQKNRLRVRVGQRLLNAR